MKGDFSFLPFDTEPHYSDVLHQQGRVLLDRDWNEAAAIAAGWRAAAGRDAFGEGVLAVPSNSIDAFKVLGARTDGAVVEVELDAGRAWADGLSLALDLAGTFRATYFAPPFQTPAATPAGIAAGVRDLVVLDVWEDTVSGFQDPPDLIEPALGGPDTTERSQSFFKLKLLRLGPNEDCGAAAGLADDFAARGRLTVSPAPVLTITGDCPLETGGGYTGLEHYLYRIEVAEPDAAGRARFKWSQWNGGLVGRGLYAAGAPGSGTVTITANDQMINHCGATVFFLEALAFDGALGSWNIVMTADATLALDGILSLTNVQGPWPAAAPATGFFRLWNGIGPVADFPAGGPNPVELKDGIRLAFDAATAGNTNYQPGDYWTFPVRASGAAFEPPVWPANAPPQGVRHHRVALAILDWNAAAPAAITQAEGAIDDCRRPFRPLSNQKICCSYIVGDGRTSHGDFDAIEEALRHLPASGGEICLLPGLHQTNAVIDGRRNVRIKGCGARTKVIPRKEGVLLPIFTVSSSVDICLEHMDMVTLSGTAIVIGAGKGGGVDGIEVACNRILGCTGAIRARGARRVNIHHNRIRMLDKRGGGVAIYLAGDDSLIERNDIRLVPAARMPPLDVPEEPEPQDPNDPCIKIDIVYLNPRLFTRYVNTVWEILLPPVILLEQPYRALGGIQLGGGCERVRVLENTVAGGAGNGITLGAPIQLPPPEPEHIFTLDQEASGAVRVLGPDGQPRANVQITLTNTATNVADVRVSGPDGTFPLGSNAASYRVTEGEPGMHIDKLEFRPDTGNGFSLTIMLKEDEAPGGEDASFLYDITIERNEISEMGLSGIGVMAGTVAPGLLRASAMAAAQAQLGAPVIKLRILDNRIGRCLLNSFDAALRATVMVQGVGGISLGMCQALAIVGNHIEDNGTSGANPVCGIFVYYGEDVEITHNRVLGNGPLTPDVNAGSLDAGHRGGIVLMAVSNYSVFAAPPPAEGDVFNRRPAARIHENLVDQPVGRALYASALGPVQCTDNAFSSELSGPSEEERLAGTVFLYDAGGIATAGAGNTAWRPARAAGAATVLPGGNVMFTANQSRTGQGNTSTACHVIATLDDLAYQDNQSASLRSGDLFANVMLTATTLRATGNRLSERGPETKLSLFTQAINMNNTSFNQGDHCIVATDANPAMAEVTTGNQVLNPGPSCDGFNTLAARLFKPLE
jgi:hypothetical protein